MGGRGQKVVLESEGADFESGLAKLVAAGGVENPPEQRMMLEGIGSL